MQQITEGEDDYVTVEEAYAMVIGEYYTAVEEQWNSATLMDGLGMRVYDSYADYSGTLSSDNKIQIMVCSKKM